MRMSRNSRGYVVMSEDERANRNPPLHYTRQDHQELAQSPQPRGILSFCRVKIRPDVCHATEQPSQKSKRAK